MMKRSVVALSILISATFASAQVPQHEGQLGTPDTSIVTPIPNPRATWVPEEYVTNLGSFQKGEGAPVDTIDVGDGRLQIVLKDDYTWEYVKNLSKIASESVFTDHWDETEINPYSKVLLTDLPYRSSIALVDSLSSFVCPRVGKVYSKFGYRRSRRHQGVDLPYPTGTQVPAAFDGRVRFTKYTAGYGNLVIIRHENGLETYYGHLSKILVKPGDWVRSGDIIALGGSTGRSSGPHLHFETRFDGFAFDPQWIVDFETGHLRKNVFVLRRSYLDAASRYVPSSIDEEEEVYASDEQIIEEEKRIAAERAAIRYYTVKSGDTFGKIAIKSGKSQKVLKSLNPSINISKLRIGQKIRVN